MVFMGSIKADIGLSEPSDWENIPRRRKKERERARELERERKRERHTGSNRE